MKNLNQYITEYIIKKKLDTPIDSKTPILYTPSTINDLKDIIIELLKDGKTDLNCIDVSNIKSMQYLFSEINYKFEITDIDIYEWDVSNVTNMEGMFFGCENFDCNLNNWNVSNVEDMSKMFYYCSNFKGKGLENWNVNKVKDMTNIFYYCDSLDKIPTWKY